MLTYKWEIVYVKNANKTNKLSLNFDIATHTVKSKNGGDVEVQNDETGQQLRRNILHLKKSGGRMEICEQRNRWTEFRNGSREKFRRGDRR